MKIKITLLSFIIGMLSLNGFSQIYVPGGSATGVKPSNNSYVGVGTATPKTAFHVEGSIYLPDEKSLWINATSDNSNRMRVGHNSSQGYSFIDYYPALHFRTGATNSGAITMSLLSNGNVGIGAFNPLEKFQIGSLWTFHDGGTKYIGRNVYYNSSGVNTRIAQGGASIVAFGDGKISLETAGTGAAGTQVVTTGNNLTLSADGYVGIGTTSPAKKLHVVGDSYFNGNMGVGTSNPAKKLHVVGDTYLNGRLGVGTSDPLVNMQIGSIWTFYDGSANKIIGRNTYYNGSNDVRIQQGVASRITFGGSGDIVFQTAPSGAAGSTVSTWNTMVMNNNGDVGIGTTVPAQKFHVAGNSYFSGNVGIGITSTGSYKLKVNGTINCMELVVSPGSRGDGDDEEIKWPDYVFADDYNLRSLCEVTDYIQQNKRLPEMPSASDIAENGINIGTMNTLLLKKVEELTLYILQQNDDIQSMKAEIRSLKEGR